MQIGYARVSTLGQSLEVQLEHLKDCDVVFREKVSGATAERTELEALLRNISKGDVLIVTKIDRLARSTKDLLEIVETLEKKNAALKILNMNLDTSTPTGRLMLTMLGAIAEFERTLMLERQAEGIAKAKENGKYKGRKPTAMAKAAQVLAMVQEGATQAKIGAELGISKMSIHRILKTA